MPRAELEVVTYNKPAMIHASREFVSQFAKYINPDWITKADLFSVAVVDSIASQKNDSLLWRTPGLDISFSGFPHAVPKIEEGVLVVSAKPPYFKMEENVTDEIRPAIRTHLTRLTKALAEEMEDVYKLQAQDFGSLTVLSFPKDRYAHDIQVVKAGIL